MISEHAQRTARDRFGKQGKPICNSFIIICLKPYFRNLIQNSNSKINVRSLEEMKKFPYSSELRVNPKNDKTFVIYVCKHEGCDKEFLRTWNLLDHARTHQNVRPHVWEYCDKAFTQKGNLRKHLMQHFQPSLNLRKKYKCRFCSKGFTEKYNYKTHLLKKHNRSNDWE